MPNGEPTAAPGATIRLNGDPHPVRAPLSVSALLAELGIDARRVAVEHNEIVVKRAAYDTTVVAAGDEVEIVNFVGGGACTCGTIDKRQGDD